MDKRRQFLLDALSNSKNNKDYLIETFEEFLDRKYNNELKRQRRERIKEKLAEKRLEEKIHRLVEGRGYYKKQVGGRQYFKQDGSKGHFDPPDGNKETIINANPPLNYGS